MNISGRWLGFYLQPPSTKPASLDSFDPDIQFPIEAWFEQSGSSLQGEMLDHRVSVIRKLADSLDGLTGSSKQRWLAFIVRFPDATTEIVFHPHSSIKGRVSQKGVRFKKTYLQPQKYILNFSDQKHITNMVGAIHYHGIISDDGAIIRGFYRVSKNPFKKASYIRQPFELVKQDLQG